MEIESFLLILSLALVMPQDSVYFVVFLFNNTSMKLKTVA